MDPADQWLTVFHDELKKISQNVNNMDRLFADILSARKLELTIDRSRNIIVGIKFQGAEEFDGNKGTAEVKNLEESSEVMKADESEKAADKFNGSEKLAEDEISADTVDACTFC